MNNIPYSRRYYSNLPWKIWSFLHVPYLIILMFPVILYLTVLHEIKKNIPDKNVNDLMTLFNINYNYKPINFLINVSTCILLIIWILFKDKIVSKTNLEFELENKRKITFLKENLTDFENNDAIFTNKSNNSSIYENKSISLKLRLIIYLALSVLLETSKRIIFVYSYINLNIVLYFSPLHFITMFVMSYLLKSRNYKNYTLYVIFILNLFLIGYIVNRTLNKFTPTIYLLILYIGYLLDSFYLITVQKFIISYKIHPIEFTSYIALFSTFINIVQYILTDIFDKCDLITNIPTCFSSYLKDNSSIIDVDIFEFFKSYTVTTILCFILGSFICLSKIIFIRFTSPITYIILYYSYLIGYIIFYLENYGNIRYMYYGNIALIVIFIILSVIINLLIGINIVSEYKENGSDEQLSYKIESISN